MKIKQHHKRKKGFLWWNTGQRFNLLHFLLPAFALLLILFAVFFQKPIIYALSAFTFRPPQPIVQSKTVLPADIQQAVKDQAQEEIKQDQASRILATNPSSANPTAQASSGVASPLTEYIVEPLQILFTAKPADKAKLRLKRIDRQIRQLETLLKTDRSDKAIKQAVGLIQAIGKETGQVAADPALQKDREILTRVIEQYNRLQLILQKVEDQLPIAPYLTIEDARVKYLVHGAQQSLNVAPNLDVTHNVALAEIKKQVGSDLAELKAIEILTDIGTGVTPGTQQKLAGLQKQLAVQFEKRMLKLPQDARNRKLQNYFTFSYGNPLRQAQAFEQMKYFLTDRDMILGVDALKELAIHRLEDRIFQIKDQKTLNQFLDVSLRDSSALKILVQVKHDVLSGKDEQKKKRIVELEAYADAKIAEMFGKKKALQDYFAQREGVSADLLDVTTIIQLAATLDRLPQVSGDVKAAMQTIKRQTLQNFVTTLKQNSFLTAPRSGYNPVASNADVRVLLADPQVIPLLEQVRDALPDNDKGAIALAEKAATALVADHILLRVNDSGILDEHQQFIANNPQVKQLIQRYVGNSFFTNLEKKKELLAKQDKIAEQQLYEKMQQIVQAIFISNDAIAEEKQLPQQVQTEIDSLKSNVADNTVPKLDMPPDVTLAKVAVLPSDVQDAIIQAAKDAIAAKEQATSSLDLGVLAKELDVSEPIILPGNPLYLVVQLERDIALVVQIDPLARAEELLKQDNEKTLEAAKLVEENQSQTTVDLALQTLDSVSQDFSKLAEHTDEIKQLEQTEPQKVDELVTNIIENGVVRQTVLSEIENTVHGDQYVAVEQIRQEVLKDGVDTLLNVTNNNVQELTDKLEQAVTSEAGSTTAVNDIKAVELLNEIARTQPESVQHVLETSEASIAATLEKTLLTQTPEQRTEELVTYAENAAGNPVRQFEAYDVLKDDFTNPQTILLTETLKDKAVENLEERIAEIPDANTQQEFVDQVVGSAPQDLKIAIELEARVEPPQNAGVVEVLPIVEKIEDIKAEIEQNIIDTYKDQPEALAQTDLFAGNTTPDVVDIQVAQELQVVLTRSPEVEPAVVTVVKEEEAKLIDTFVENISKPEFSIAVSAQASVSGQTNISELAAETLSPTPETLVTLVELKAEVPPAEQGKIAVAITIQVELMQEYVTHVTDPVILQTYIAQITQDPIIAQVVQQVGGQQFQQVVEQKTESVQQEIAQEQVALEATVTQVQDQIFSSPASTPIEQTLPVAIQQEIQEIKQEVPVEQIPVVNVSEQTTAPATVTVESAAPVSQPVSQPVSEPAPSAPSAPAPAPPEPAAPSAPSL